MARYRPAVARRRTRGVVKAGRDQTRIRSRVSPRAPPAAAAAGKKWTSSWSPRI